MKKINETMKTSIGVTDNSRTGLTKQIVAKVFNVELNPFGYENRDEYESYLRKLGPTDLDSHATKVGLRPIDDKRIQRERCLGEFDELMRKRRQISAQTNVRPTRKESEAFGQIAAVKFARG